MPKRGDNQPEPDTYQLLSDPGRRAAHDRAASDRHARLAETAAGYSDDVREWPW